MDEERIRANCRMYLDAFRAAFGDAALPLYAGKAASFKQMYRIMADEGMGVEAVNTGTVDVKFGVPLETGQAFAFVQEALALDGMEAVGLHCHVGSMVFDGDVFERTLDIMVSFMAFYNRLCRPPVVMLRGGESYVAVRRERVEDLWTLDL